MLGKAGGIIEEGMDPPGGRIDGTNGAADSADGLASAADDARTEGLDGTAPPYTNPISANMK